VDFWSNKVARKEYVLSDNANGLRVLVALSRHEKTTTNYLYNEGFHKHMRTVGESHGTVENRVSSRMANKQHVKNRIFCMIGCCVAPQKGLTCPLQMYHDYG
jgi:hypothetical protein